MSHDLLLHCVDEAAGDEPLEAALLLHSLHRHLRWYSWTSI
jgi:hypothetical protein